MLLNSGSILDFPKSILSLSLSFILFAILLSHRKLPTVPNQGYTLYERKNTNNNRKSQEISCQIYNKNVISFFISGKITTFAPTKRKNNIEYETYMESGSPLRSCHYNCLMQ